MADTEYAWRVETTQPRVQGIDIFSGESVRLRAAIYIMAQPAAFPDGATAALYWQAPGMGSSWWTASASIDGNEVFADWLPEYGGGPEYEVFLAVDGEGATYRAVARVAIRHAPGEIPNELPLPQRKIDFALVEIENAPWALATHSHAESDIADLASDLAAKADRAENPVAGHLASLDSDGDPADSGIALANGLIPAASVAGLAAVATSGAYSSLTGRPTIPTVPSALKCPSYLSLTIDGTAISYDGSAARSATINTFLAPTTISKMNNNLSLPQGCASYYKASASNTLTYAMNGRTHVFGTFTVLWMGSSVTIYLTVTDPDGLIMVAPGQYTGMNMVGQPVTFSTYSTTSSWRFMSISGISSTQSNPSTWQYILRPDSSPVPALFSSGGGDMAGIMPTANCRLVVDATEAAFTPTVDQALYPCLSDDPDALDAIPQGKIGVLDFVKLINVYGGMSSTTKYLVTRRIVSALS